ncbi:MAG: hypothetical protein ACKOXK_03760 [Chakrabartia sp.]
MPDDTDTPEENETVRAVKRARARAEAAAAADDKKPINWKAAAGIGIGSAAILGALIYASRQRNKNK